MQLNDILACLSDIPPKLRQEVVAACGLWVPNPGPQSDGFFCEADELFYGGGAGGGKTDLGIGLSLTEHTRSLLLRKTNKEADKLVDRVAEVLGSRAGWNGRGIWHLADRTLDIGGCQFEDDKQKYKGSPHDLIFFDEVSDFTETQYRFIIGWNRSTDQKQRCRVVAAGNPPTTPEGLWVLIHWGPWLDPSHPNPAKQGELRWFTTVAGEDTEVVGRGPHLVNGELVVARSRTFIRALLDDNPDLARTDYGSVLSALPAPLRSAYKEGDFGIGLADDAWQVIPTRWIEEAQARWTPIPPDRDPMVVMGLDVAQGGDDNTVLIWRHAGWYSKPVIVPGAETPLPSDCAALVVKYRRNNAHVIVDVGGGYGGGVVERLRENGCSALPFNGANFAPGKTKDGRLSFVNKRALAWWKLREALDPDQPFGSSVALPNDPVVRADLASARWKLTSRGIQLEDKAEIKKRIGRSPDVGDAIVMAWEDGQRAIKLDLLPGNKLQSMANRGPRYAPRRY